MRLQHRSCASSVWPTEASASTSKPPTAPARRVNATRGRLVYSSVVATRRRCRAAPTTERVASAVAAETAARTAMIKRRLRMTHPPLLARLERVPLDGHPDGGRLPAAAVL